MRPPRALDSFKTELIADRSWATRSQLELAILEYVAWFNNERLNEALDDRPPRESRGTIRCEKPGNHTHKMNVGNLQKR
jgi:transposase InsO family protein